MRVAVAALLALVAVDAGATGRLDAYIAELESADRGAWQQPEKVIATLHLRRGMVIADIGAGTGYFARRFAGAIGPKGRVIALDVDGDMLEELRRRALDAKNVDTRTVAPDDPALAPRSVDLVFVCNTGHHLPDRVRYYGKLRRALRPGGRLVLIDFYKRTLPLGPPVAEKVSRAQTLREAGAAGFRLRASHAFLPYQYFLELE